MFPFQNLSCRIRNSKNPRITHTSPSPAKMETENEGNIQHPTIETLSFDDTRYEIHTNTIKMKRIVENKRRVLTIKKVGAMEDIDWSKHAARNASNT